MPPFVRWLKVFFALLLGLGYALNADTYANNPTFFYVQDSFLTVRGWGWIFVGCAFLLAWTRIAGCAISTLIWLTWGLLLVSSANVGLLTSWGAAAWPFFFASLNAGEVVLWYRALAREGDRR